MSFKYNNNIIVHDLSQKLNFYAKHNIFSGYLNEQNKSTNIRYKKQKQSDSNYINKTSDKNFLNLKQRKSQSLIRAAPKYLFPSMENNLLLENLFQRNSQILPNISKAPKLFQSKFDNKGNKTNVKKNTRRKTVFLSTTSFDIKKKTKFIKSQKKTNIKSNVPFEISSFEKY